MIGVLTNFYGYWEGELIEKVKKLVDVFGSVGFPPLIQINYSVVGEENPEKLAANLNKLKKQFGIVYCLHNAIWLPKVKFFLNLGSTDLQVKQDTIKSFKTTIDFARKIQAKTVSFHGGYGANFLSQEKELDVLTIDQLLSDKEAYGNVRQGLKTLLDYAGDDVKLSLENLSYRPEQRYLFSQPENFENLPENLGFLFDTGHAYFSQTKTGDTSYIKKMIDIMSPKITEIHASDNNGLEDEHRLPGFGKVPLAEIFQSIAKKQLLPSIIIEASQKKHNYSDQDLKNSIKKLSSLIS